MKIVVIDSGGRGDSLAWMFGNDARVKEIHCIPGNAGMSFLHPKTMIVPDLKNPEKILEYAINKNIDLTIVGAEAYLSKGISDLFQGAGLKIIGPTQEATILESSKRYTDFLAVQCKVPVPDFEIFHQDEVKYAKRYVKDCGYKVVVKCDGLAEGKGSIVCDSVEEAEAAIDHVFNMQKDGKWGGDTVVIQRRLYGKELTFTCLTDGYTLVPFPVAQDYKRAKDGDQGKNTGGMGGYSPHDMEGNKLTDLVINTVAQPILDGFREKHGILFNGFLYFGLMLVEGVPYLLEINVRLGDPEAELILPRLKTNFLDICLALVEERLHELVIEWSNDYIVDVVVISGRTRGKKGWYKGYPERYKIGLPITGLDDAAKIAYTLFSAGITNKDDGTLITSGGRVLHCIGRGETLEKARQQAYSAAERIKFDGAEYRNDIAKNK